MKNFIAAFGKLLKQKGRGYRRRPGGGKCPTGVRPATIRIPSASRYHFAAGSGLAILRDLIQRFLWTITNT